MWDFLDEQEDADTTDDDQQDKPCRISIGQDCPRCGQAKLDYNSLLNLSCPHCGYEVNASFT